MISVWVVLLFVAMHTTVIVVVVYGMVSGCWHPLERRYPAREELPGTIRRKFQSIKLDMLNLGWCVHISIDKHYLHLDPTLLLRWFKAQRISLPWQEIKVRKIGRWGGKADIGRGTVLYAPVWALKLAEADSVPTHDR